MAVIVTLDVYSGVPNPSWVLEDDQVKELQKMIGRKKGAKAQGGSLPLLGYRGFLLRPVASEHARATRVEGLMPSHARSEELVLSGIPTAEEFLLSTAGDRVDATLKRHVQETISAGHTRSALMEPITAAKKKVTCPKCHAADAPTYNPGFWNVPARQPYNNCYNYANDQATNTFAQPGRATSHMYTALTCPSVQPAAVSDGLAACANFHHHLAKGHGWYLALVIWPGYDYHWYRQDKVGCWSHKPGSTPARNTDNSGAAIVDPQTCNRGPYTEFCSYTITTRRVKIS
jgi:hypothetical protein